MHQDTKSAHLIAVCKRSFIVTKYSADGCCANWTTKVVPECHEFWCIYTIDSNAAKYVLGILKIILAFTLVNFLDMKFSSVNANILLTV